MTTIELKDGTRLVVRNGKVVLKKSSNAFPFLAILCLIFVIAKLTGHFNYSWWVVFAPMWVGPAIVFGILGAVVGIVLAIAVVVGIIFLIGFLIDTWKTSARRRGRARNSIIER